MRRIKKPLFAVLVLLQLAACGGQIPSSYRGTYFDWRTGRRLELEASEGVFSFPDFRVYRARAEFATFESLRQAKAGLYLQINGQDAQQWDVYWIRPDPGSIQEISGFLTYRAELISTKVNLRVDGIVPQLFVYYSQDATLLIDTVTEQWQVSWPEETKPMQMRRQ